MTLAELTCEVQNLTCLDDVPLIESLARANWPAVEEFKPVQARLLANLIFRRIDGPPRKELRL
jgi:hypothetical protein